MCLKNAGFTACNVMGVQILGRLRRNYSLSSTVTLTHTMVHVCNKFFAVRQPVIGNNAEGLFDCFIWDLITWEFQTGKTS